MNGRRSEAAASATTSGKPTKAFYGAENMADLKPYLFKVTVHVVCILAVGIPILLFKLLATPFHRGFFCDDDSIRYPFKDSTVTSLTLYFVGTTLNLIAFLIFERLRVTRLELPPRVIGAFRIHPFVWELYNIAGVFAFGCCVSQLTTDIGKYTIGRLRPHFLDVCKLSAGVCHSGNEHEYITADVCTGDRARIREARLSFPSGHSSFSAFTMVFLTLYLQARMPRRFRVEKPLVQFTALMLATGTALSRVSDYKHHWSDVLAGSLQGTIVALLIVFFVSDLFKKPPTSKTQDMILPTVVENPSLTAPLSRTLTSAGNDTQS